MSNYDRYHAMQIADGQEHTKSMEAYYAAWQLLIDDDLLTTLPPRFTSRAAELIQEGKLKELKQ